MKEAARCKLYDVCLAQEQSVTHVLLFDWVAMGGQDQMLQVSMPGEAINLSLNSKSLASTAVLTFLRCMPGSSFFKNLGSGVSVDNEVERCEEERASLTEQMVKLDIARQGICDALQTTPAEVASLAEALERSRLAEEAKRQREAEVKRQAEEQEAKLQAMRQQRSKVGSSSSSDGRAQGKATLSEATCRSTLWGSGAPEPQRGLGQSPSGVRGRAPRRNFEQFGLKNTNLASEFYELSSPFYELSSPNAVAGGHLQDSTSGKHMA